MATEPTHRGVLESDRTLIDTSDGVKVKVRTGKLSLCAKLSYSLGHVLNDLTASVWFTYMLIYLQVTINLGPVIAGRMILLGQVVDAVSNPVVGLLSNTGAICLKTCNRRKKWHVLGTAGVTLTFPLMLSGCFGCGAGTPRWVLILVYGVLIALFQFAWAATQISHLSLITDLSQLDKDRRELNAMRYGATVVSNMIVYITTWILFGAMQITTKKTGEIQESDAMSFATLSYVVVGVGLAACVMFYIGTPLPATSDTQKSSTDSHSGGGPIQIPLKLRRTPIACLKDHKFYLLALVYMCARLTVNLTQVYTPFFVTTTLQLEKDSIATYPLVMYIASFLTTIIVKLLAQHCPSEMMYVWGALNVIAASLWMVFLQPHSEIPTFGTAVFSGVGGAAVMVTSLSLVSEYIGQDHDNSAFVFGAMGFCDKLCNGIAVFILQDFSPCGVADSISCNNYIRTAIGIVPGATIAVSILILLLTLRSHKDRSPGNYEQLPE